MSRVLTSEIGAFVKDALSLLDGTLDANVPEIFVETVDAADLNNLQIFLSNGQSFTVRIVAEAGR